MRRGAEHAEFVPDEIVDRFCVIGTVEECTAKLQELAGIGVHPFNFLAQVDSPDAVIESYGSLIVPTFR